MPASALAILPSLAIHLLDCRVRVTAPTELLPPLAAMFAQANSWAESHPATAPIEACVAAERMVQGWQLLVDGEPTIAVSSPDALAGALEWQVVGVAVQRLASRYLLLHAGALDLDGRGILLPAASRSGKTTLTAALVAAGCRYYSDDIAALTRHDLLLHPFLRSLCIKPGSFEVLSRDYPQLAGSPAYARFRAGDVRYLAPSPEAVPDSPVPIRCIVFPRYVLGAATELTPLRRAEALPRLLDGLCNPRAQLGRDLPPLLELLRGAACYTLTVGDLDRAVRSVLDVAAGPGRPSPTSMQEGSTSV